MYCWSPLSAQTQHKMKCRFLCDIVIRERAPIFELLACENEALLIRRNAFLVLNLRLDGFDIVAWFYVERDGLPRESLNEDLHASMGIL